MLRNFRIVGLHDLNGLHLTLPSLLERISELDRMLFSGSNQPVGNIQQWLPIFHNHPQTWRAILSGHGELVAYWQTAIVENALYSDLKSGLVNEAALGLSSYLDISSGGVFNMYFVSICAHPAYRGVEANFALMESFFSLLNDLSEKNTFFREITCCVCSQEGEQIAKVFRLGYLGDNSTGKVYSGRTEDVLCRLKGQLKSRHPGLLGRYLRNLT